MPPVQTQIRGYEVLERLGTGAESVIYKAREMFNSRRVVAIKHIIVNGRENQKYLRHASNEFRVLKELHAHPDGPPPRIVQAYSFSKSGIFRKRKEGLLAMEFIEGSNLRQERRYPMGQLVNIFSELSDTLSGLHRRGYIHGDLKPENIIVTPAGDPVLVDFGFAIRAGERAGSIRGTRDYMAPEQVDMGALTEKTDIYNLGATMYFLFSGKHVPALMAQPGGASLFIGSRTARAPSLRAVEPNIPQALDDIIIRCVSKDPLDRPSCVDEVRTVLREVNARHFG